MKQKAVKISFSLALALLVLLPFQNCSSGLQMNPRLEFASLSSSASIARFSAAKNVLVKNCNSCHSGSSAPILDFGSENAFVNAGLVVPGNLGASKLIYRLKNYPNKNGLQNMPTTGNISDSDYAILTNWVTMFGQNNSAFNCSPSEAPSTLNAKRLSKEQINNSLHDLIARALGATVSKQILTEAQVQVRLPADSLAPFSSSDANFSPVHGKAMMDIADTVAKQVVTQPNYAKFVSTFINYSPGTCSNYDPLNLNQECFQIFIKNFLLRAWGHPAEVNDANANNELAAFAQEFQLNSSSPAAVEAVVFRALLAPKFIYHLQIDLSPSGGFHRLSSHLIARRLAFMFTQTLPDETLIQFADSKDLFGETEFMQALELVSGKMDKSLNMFAKEWLRTDKFPQYGDQSHPKFALITQGLTVDQNLRSAMTDEMVELFSYIAQNKKPLSELLTTDISFARNSSLMKIYNQTSPAPINVTDSNAVRFPVGERSGLLTRAGMLFSGKHTESPIHRGIHVRQQMFCLSVTPPPPNLADQLTDPLPDVNLTTRERYHNKTSGTACIGCHSQINPLGFAFSKYNAFGGLQTHEPIYDNSAPAQLARYLPTNSQVDLLPALGINATTSDPIEFSEVAADSSLFNKCFTRNYFTFIEGLSGLTSETNSCSMKRMYQSLENKQSMSDFFKSSVLDVRFRYRKLDKVK